MTPWRGPRGLSFGWLAINGFFIHILSSHFSVLRHFIPASLYVEVSLSMIIKMKCHTWQSVIYLSSYKSPDTRLFLKTFLDLIPLFSNKVLWLVNVTPTLFQNQDLVTRLTTPLKRRYGKRRPRYTSNYYDAVFRGLGWTSFLSWWMLFFK